MKKREESQLKLKITSAVFIITSVFIIVLYFSIPSLAAQSKLTMAAELIVTGLVLAGILSAVTYGLAQSIPAKIVEVEKREMKPEAPPAPGKRPFDEKAVQVLSILQKKGRLIDFLEEDISNYQDSQIGAAVRNIHKDTRDAITEHVKIEPVLKDAEGSQITVEKGFDPSAIRLTGNVVGSPPFKGILRHSGWRVSATSIPVLPENQDPAVIEPAEVEIV